MLSIQEKAKNGRCVGFPGYCDNNQDTCPKFHPVVMCTRYPKCDKANNGRYSCTFIHPICEYDCCKIVCKSSNCQKYHPFRDSYYERYNKYPDDDSENINQLQSIPEPDKFELSSVPNTMNQPGLTPEEREYEIRKEIQFVLSTIHRLELDDKIRNSKYFNQHRCLKCRSRAASQISEICGHMIYCDDCILKIKRCLLCWEFCPSDQYRSLLRDRWVD